MSKEQNKKIIGKIIRNKRLKKGLTQLEVATEAQLSRNYIADIENGRYMPSVNTLVKIANFLKINLNFLNNMTEIQNIKEGYNAKIKRNKKS